MNKVVKIAFPRFARKISKTTEANDKKLRARVKLLGRLLGNVLQSQTGGRVFNAVETLRKGYIRLHEEDSPALRERLGELIRNLDADTVTHVVRGADLFAATHVHRLLQALLGLPTPVYRHHALLADAAGNRLAKRTGAPSLETLRLAGMDGRALADDLRAGRLPSGFSAASD